MTRKQVLVSCRWLKEALGQSNLRVLEASWVAKGQGMQKYIEEHIPSARFFDLWENVVPTASRARPLPNMYFFAQQLERQGVTDSSELVLYDKGPMFFAARLWLQCRELGLENVSVLDGGFPHWKSEGFPTETGEGKQTEVGSIDIKRRQCFMGREELSRLLTRLQIDSNAAQIVDVRQGQHFKGEAEEPTTMTAGALKGAGLPIPTRMHRGHMIGAKNLHYGGLIDPETKCFKGEAELRQLFEDAGIDLENGGPLVSSCYNGIAACLIPLAADKLGVKLDKSSVYVGSWTEFGQDGNEYLVETGENKKTRPAAA